MRQIAGDLPPWINGIQLNGVERAARPCFMEVSAMRFWLCLTLAAIGVLAISQPSQAQQLPFSNIQQTPTVSPYLNLTRNNSGPATYQSLVQPIVQQQQQSALQQGQINRLQNQTSALSKGAGLANPARGASSAIRGTGHVTAFMDTSHYFPRFQGRSAPQ